MRTEAQAIADAADANLLTRLPAAEQMQEAYFAANGRYWQGLWSQPKPPADGEIAAPVLDTRPTDQLETRLDTGAAALFPADAKTRLAVDAYAGPLGHGWVVLLEFEYAGVRHVKSISYGPEDRSHDWQEVSYGTY